MSQAAGPRARRRVRRAVAGILVSGALVVGSTGGASADAVDTAKAQAAAAAAGVRALQPAVDAALASYEQSLTSMAQSVTSSLSAKQQAQELQQQAAALAAAQANRVRAIYMAGGAPALYAGLLGSGSAGELFRGVGYVDSILGAGESGTTAAYARSAALTRTADALSAAADASVVSATTVAERYARVEALLSRQRGLLSRLSTTAAQMVEARAAALRVKAAQSAADSSVAQRVAGITASGIPADFFAWFHGAAKTCPGLSWTVLAAIGQVESHDGRGGTSPAGAQGPMQFLQSTFDAYAVDGDHDGVLDIHDPADAIYTAAHYLCANGAGGGPDGLRFAIFRYNHADWYVALILRLAGELAARWGG